jgi:hypothetical protein
LPLSVRAARLSTTRVVANDARSSPSARRRSTHYSR